MMRNNRKVTGREMTNVLVPLYYAHIQSYILSTRNYVQNITKGWSIASG